MSQNLVIPGADNKVRFVFAGVDLTAATNLQVVFGSETYTLALNPTIVFVESATVLALDLNATAEVGKVFVTVKYFDAGTTLGEEITSRELGNSTQIVVAIGSQLIIETGAGVNNSNSYVSDAMLKNYASIRNISLPATQPDREALLIKAMDYIESYRDQFQGEKTNYLQSLQWPRYSVLIDGYDIGSTTIPNELKNAQIEAAIIANSTPLLQSGATLNVQKEKIGDLEVAYFEGGAWSTLRTDNVDVWLNVLTSNNSSGINAKVTRA